MQPPRSRRPATRAVAALSALCLIASCSANPGPPPLVEPESAQSETSGVSTTPSDDNPRRSDRTQVQVGVDPVRGGFNPHLIADDSSTVRAIADLTLPSAYVGTSPNRDLLVGVSTLPTSPAAQTVRYVIAPEAQWSDGTPITGSDFAYLWRGMVTTAGTVNPAAYRAIQAIRISGQGGKIVDVDFERPVANREELFAHLLPSHLFAADASDFPFALRNMVPASAGRFLMADVGRARGTVVLNRNDRFWGAEPASVDILTLTAARDTTQTADQLRSGQLVFADVTPQETTEEVFRRVPGVEVREESSSRVLGVVISATSGLDQAMREQVRSLIDVPLLAHIAAARSTNLAVAEHTFTPGEKDTAALRARTVPIRVGADAMDPAAAAAARTLVDILNGAGIPAKLTSTDATTLAGRSLPSSEVDLAVVWQRNSTSMTTLASRMACPSKTSRAGNLSGLCSVGNEALAGRILDGTMSATEARAAVSEAEERDAVWVPILNETRIAASSGGVAIPGVSTWPGGISDAARWQLADTVGPTPKEKP